MRRVSVSIRLMGILAVCLLAACRKDRIGTLELIRVLIGETVLPSDGSLVSDLPLDRSITLVFSGSVDQGSARTAILLVRETDSHPVAATLGFLSDGTNVVIRPAGPLETNTVYIVRISDGLIGTDGSRLPAREFRFRTRAGDLQLLSLELGGEEQSERTLLLRVPLDLDLTIRFSGPVDPVSLAQAVILSGRAGNVPIQHELSADGRVLQLRAGTALDDLSRYELQLTDALRGTTGDGFAGLNVTLYTTVSETPKFPVMADDALLSLVQQQTFRYFWEFAHPASGMARERNTSGDLVTSGGSGFGILALIVGMERGFITRTDGLTRLATLLTFLEHADRFHGAWPHWLDGNTGRVIPFSANDNGGDLVETALLMQGLLTMRQYLNASVAAEQQLIDRINGLWRTVEWDWYRRDEQQVLYWHWSPDKGWIMNLPIRGWNEALIVYVLAASSPTHGIPASVYTEGWARNGQLRNGQTYEGLVLPLGPDYGGPLFFSQYSFLGLDPRGLRDTYADYWIQQVNHTQIQYRYADRNPRRYAGYGAPDGAWGLTASDSYTGYHAHSPANDLGVIAPTAALSAFPYTPDASMEALRFFYYAMGDRLWGPYGFYDAFNLTEQWVADSYLAIDQGPIIAMIENYRTGLLWELFMSAPEIRNGLRNLGFDSPKL